MSTTHISGDTGAFKLCTIVVILVSHYQACQKLQCLRLWQNPLSDVGLDGKDPRDGRRWPSTMRCH